MGATFPNGIASFATHRDNYDDIEASDINKIQDEIVAIEEALGDALTSLSIIESEVDVLQDEQNTDSQTDTLLIKRFQNLKELIATLWDGGNIYAASTSMSNKQIKATPKDRPYPPDIVRLNAPSSGHDPMGLWNGTGFTLRKSGLWMCHGNLDFNLADTGASSNKNFGTYEASVTIDGTNWIRGLDRRYPVLDKTWHDVVLNPMVMGWFPKGTHISLRAAQSSDLAQNVNSGNLGVFRIRGF